MSRFGLTQILLVLLAIALIIAGLSFGSYYVSLEELTARRGGVLSFIPLDYRLMLVEYRLLVGLVSSSMLVLLGGSWLAAELIARLWQRARNRELAANAVLLRIAPRVDERGKWEAAADMWAAIHSTLARSKRQVWLGAGLHLSLEIVQQVGERITFYLWAPRPVAEMLTRQLRATYAGLEIETLIKAGEASTPTNQIDDYLDLPDDINPKSEWRWADLGTGRDTWRPLRIKFAGDPLPSLLSALEGLAPGNQLAAIHYVLRPAANGWQNGGQAFISKLRGDNVKPGKPRPKLGSQDRELIKQIEQKAQARVYDLCLRVLVAGQGDVDGNLERLVRVFDQFGADNTLAARATPGFDPQSHPASAALAGERHHLARRDGPGTGDWHQSAGCTGGHRCRSSGSRCNGGYSKSDGSQLGNGGPDAGNPQQCPASGSRGSTAADLCPSVQVVVGCRLSVRPDLQSARPHRRPLLAEPGIEERARVGPDVFRA